MQKACNEIFPSCQGAILAAAVADYRVKEVSSSKIKKKDDDLSLELVKNPDILAGLGKNKKKGQILIGFALETDNEYDNALTKLEKKNLDFIVLNSLNDKDAGFGKSTNKVTIIERNGKSHTFESKPKKEVANDIIDLLEKHL